MCLFIKKICFYPQCWFVVLSACQPAEITSCKAYDEEIPLRQRATQRKSTTSKSNNLLGEQPQRLSQFFENRTYRTAISILQRKRQRDKFIIPLWHFIKDQSFQNMNVMLVKRMMGQQFFAVERIN